MGSLSDVLPKYKFGVSSCQLQAQRGAEGQAELHWWNWGAALGELGPAPRVWARTEPWEPCGAE